MKIASALLRAAYPLAALAVIALSLMPTPPRIDIDLEYLDKVEHALAYMVLGFLGLAFFRSFGAGAGRAFALSMGIGIAIGVAIEFIQPYVGRSFELADMAVDLAGLAAGGLCLIAASRAARSGRARGREA